MHLSQSAHEIEEEVDIPSSVWPFIHAVERYHDYSLIFDFEFTGKGSCLYVMALSVLSPRMVQEVSDHGSSKPVPPTISLSLLTWNVNKKKLPDGVSQQGSSNRRDTIIPLVLEHLDKQGQRPPVRYSLVRNEACLACFWLS